MPAFNAPKILRLVPPPDTGFGSQTSSHLLRLHHDVPAPATVVVTARGEIDAWNAGDLADYLRGDVGPYSRLVLDFRRVNFFALAGLSALQAVTNEGLASSRIAIVPSTAVVRLLRLCIPGTPLPIFEDIATARAAVRNERVVLKVISGLGEAGSSLDRSAPWVFDP